MHALHTYNTLLRYFGNKNLDIDQDNSQYREHPKLNLLVVDVKMNSEDCFFLKCNWLTGVTRRVARALVTFQMVVELLH